MKVKFLNQEQTEIELTTGRWWWKRVAQVRKVPFEERYKPDEGWTDPVRYRYVATNDPVPDLIVQEIYLAMYYAERPARLAETKRQYEANWRRP